MTVHYTVGGGTAAAGTDYTLMSQQTVTFLPGCPLTEPIPGLHAGRARRWADKTLMIALSSVAGPAMLQQNTVAVFTIDESQPAAPVATGGSDSGGSGLDEPNLPLRQPWRRGAEGRTGHGIVERQPRHIEFHLRQRGQRDPRYECLFGRFARGRSPGQRGRSLQRADNQFAPRYDHSGNLDSSFSANVATDFSGVGDWHYAALAVEADSSILVAYNGPDAQF